jgi:ABC-type glycerol-3-phosphate transport system substrate-binding protein
MIKKTTGILAGSMLVSVVAGCSGGSNETPKPTAQQPVEDTKPVELNVWLVGAYKHEEFMDSFGNDIVKKYPNVSFKVYSKPTTPLKDLVTAGTKLDLIQDTTPKDLLDNGLESDITDLIKKYSYDLNKLDPQVLESMKQIGKGQIFGLPNAIATVAMYYNKDIFKRFGVPFPTNGMTWDEVYELAKKLTRTVDGVNYQGFIENATYMTFYSQLYPGYVDPNTDKAMLNNDTWRKIISNFERFYKIPGNPYIATTPNDAFMKEKRAAMYATQLAGGMMRNLTRAGVDWGVVSLPEYADHRGVGPGMQIPVFYVAKNSPNRDWAFKVAAYMASEEYQRLSAPKGGIPPMRDRSVMADYAKEDPEIPADKNVIQAVPKSFAKPMPVTRYDTLGSSRLNTAYVNVLKGTKDVNTALREQEEALNKAIEEEKKK